MFPPLWHMNNFPMLSLPAISGCLRHYGHKSFSLDLNCDFMNYVLTEEFYENVKAFYNQMIDKKPYTVTLSPQEDLLRATLTRKLSSFISTYNTFGSKSNILNVFKCENNFYNSSVLSEGSNKIRELVYIAFELSEFYFAKDNIINFNIFDEYYQSITDKIVALNPDYIGFSVSFVQQYEWSKNFAKRLKKLVNAHISFGGCEVSLRKEEFLTDFDFFKDCADSVMYGDGEVPILKLADYISGKVSIKEVPGITYLDKDGKIKFNNPPKKSLNKMFPACFDGFEMDKYFINKLVLPVEYSRGCYYGKCEFCTYTCGTVPIQKTPEELVNEIKELQEKYGVDIFYFTDSSLHPDFADKFSKLIIEKGLKIYYFSFVRLDKRFSKKLLQQMYKSGMRYCMWGLESGSERILNLYKKGTNNKTNQKILEDAHSVGLVNFVFLIAGFPKELPEDLNKTVDFLLKNKEYIDYYEFHNFTLAKNAPMANHPERFGLTKEDFNFDGPFSNYYSTDLKNGELDNAINTVAQAYHDKIKDLPNEFMWVALYAIKKSSEAVNIS